MKHHKNAGRGGGSPGTMADDLERLRLVDWSLLDKCKCVEVIHELVDLCDAARSTEPGEWHPDYQETLTNIIRLKP